MELIFEQFGRSVLKFSLQGRNKVTVGRGKNSDVRLFGSDISREHLEFCAENKAWIVKSLSKRKTLLNGAKLSERTLLTPNDRIEFGSWKIYIKSKSEYKDDITGSRSFVNTVKFDENVECAPAPKINLIVRGEKSRIYSLKKDITVGKHSDCKLQIDDPYISNWHCTISWSGKNVLIRDDGSTNGTYLEGTKVNTAKLEPNGKINLGETEISYSIQKVNNNVCEDPIVGKCSKLKEIMKQLSKVAPLDVSVCVFGESGTGKELVAKFIHENSSRNKKPFIALNCGAIAKTLMEGILFGHEKGAFTGAIDSKEGLFEQACDGTLFLDEIGELDLEMQTRLLRVLETNEVKRLGGKENKKVNFRLITATNRNLQKEVVNGNFREDLFHRIFVIPINVPPLRKRGEDVVILAEHFLNIFSPTGSHVFSESAKNKLMSYFWPGNIRELKNTIQRSLICASGNVIDAKNLSIIEVPRSQSSRNRHLSKFGGELTLKDHEKNILLDILEKSDNNVSMAARSLGIARSSMRSKLKKYGIEP